MINFFPTFSGISTAKPLHNPTSIIKDEPNGSEDTQIQFNENLEDEDHDADDDEEENFEKNSIKYEEKEEVKENNHEEKLEPKDIIVSIKDANEDSSSRSSSEAEDVKDEPAENIDAILGKFFFLSVRPNRIYRIPPKLRFGRIQEY